MRGFKSADSYYKFSRDVCRSNRYFRGSETDEFFAILLQQAQLRRNLIPKGTIFYRAQLGHGLEPHYDQEEYSGDVPCPFPTDRMKPLRDRAAEGRANPKGIPCLYISNLMETVLSEVRPWRGSLISIAQFQTLRDLTIVDCTTTDKPRRIFYKGIPPEDWDKAVWFDIDRDFSKPVTRNEDLADYVPTQIIAELFKSNGFDGIEYQSSLGSGHNFALFDIDCANLTSRMPYKTNDIKFDFSRASNPYWKPK